MLKKKCTVIIITSDKSYKNLEIKREYKEDDLLGGLDPYSASKGSAEFIIKSYLNSYFNKKKQSKYWHSEGRQCNWGRETGQKIDLFRLYKILVKKYFSYFKKSAFYRTKRLYVLEALGGYLIFALKLNKNNKLHGHVFNFGPSNNNNFSVLALVKTMKSVGVRLIGN